MRMPLAFVWVIGLALSACSPASAQSSYVTGALGGDFFRFDRDVEGDSETGAPDAALGGAVRAGTAFGERWGVEIEFAFAREIASEQHGADFRAVLRGFPTGAVFFSSPSPLSAPPPVFHVNVTRRHSTVNTLGWVSKELRDDADLVVLFGLGLRRTTLDATLSVEPASAGGVRPESAHASRSQFGPVVGTDVRMRIADRWRFVPSARLQGLDSGGWLLRTTAGVEFVF